MEKESLQSPSRAGIEGTHRQGTRKSQVPLLKWPIDVGRHLETRTETPILPKSSFS